MAEVALAGSTRRLGEGDRPNVVPHEKWLDEKLAEDALQGSDKTRIFFRPRVRR